MFLTMPPVRVQKLPNFPATNELPKFMTAGAACADIQSAVPVTLLAGQSKVVPTGLAFAVPDGYEMQVRSRSGLAAKHAVFVTNGIGVIDCDYRGEVHVLLTNAGDADIHLLAGARIGQLAFAPVFRPQFTAVDELSPTARGSGGFGSTGR